VNKTRNVLYGLAFVLFIALGFNIFMGMNLNNPVAHAVWEFNPTSMDELKGKSTNIISGKVINIQQGEDIVYEHEDEPEPTIIPTQVITLKVTESLKGNSTIGEQIKVFRTGGENVIFLEEDPEYVKGKEYMLFLRPQENSNLFLMVAPTGRYTIVNGKIESVIETGFGSEFNGLGVQEFVKKLKN
jgi:hypothetical protein